MDLREHERQRSLKAIVAFKDVVTFKLKLSPDDKSVGFSVSLGQSFDVALVGAPQAPIEWSAGDDEVLEITDDSGPIASIKATAEGVSLVDLKARDRVIGSLLIDVTKPTDEEAARFDVPPPVKEDLP